MILSREPADGWRLRVKTGAKAPDIDTTEIWPTMKEVPGPKPSSGCFEK